MKKVLLSLATIIALQVCYAQGDVKTLVNDANAVKRNVGSFHGVQVSSAITLHLMQGNEDAVAVSSSDASETDKIKTEVKNGVLKIWTESNSFWGSWKDRKIKAYVSIKRIDYLGASGASNIKISETLKAGDLNIEAKGASAIKGNIKAGNLKLDISGASTLTLAGTATDAKLDISGASSVKAYDLLIDNCYAEASGASNVGINVSTKLKAEASGASSIRYKGNASVQTDVSGASSIKKKED